MTTQLSVVIPTRDRAQSVCSAVASVLDQARDDVEVVVVDDASRDGTRAALARVDDARLRVVDGGGHGAASARNVGAAAACGTAVVFLDSDDIALPGWVAFFVASLAGGRNELASCGAVQRFADGDRRTVLPARLGPAYASIEALFLPGTYGLMKQVFDSVGGFDAEMPAAQHTELALRLAQVHGSLRTVVTHDVLLEMDRAAGRSGIRTDDRAVFEGSVRLITKHGDALRRDRRDYSNQAATAAYRALRLGRYHDSVKWYKESLRFSPRPRRAARLVHAAALALVGPDRPRA